VVSSNDKRLGGQTVKVVQVNLFPTYCTTSLLLPVSAITHDHHQETFKT
jgi:hypothetical protein